jgi:hypothetical protein
MRVSLAIDKRKQVEASQSNNLIDHDQPFQ